MPQKFSVIKKFRYIECCTSEHSLGGLIILHNIPASDHAILKFVPPSKVMKHDLSAFSAISMTINDIKGDKFLYRKKCSRYSKRIGESQHLFPQSNHKTGPNCSDFRYMGCLFWLGAAISIPLYKKSVI